MAKLMIGSSDRDEVGMLLTALGFVLEKHDTKVSEFPQNGHNCRSVDEIWELATATHIVVLRDYAFTVGGELLEREVTAEVFDNPTGKVMAC